MSDATWLLRLDSVGDGPRLAVKDCIDVAGTPTTVGCRAIADAASPAAFDAPVVENARRQGARIVGKTNLVELCRHADGVNPWTGTPRNPLDPDRIPGGSSSGSAVAVARGQADVAYGTDTGGSVRVPAACCGIAGLKTTAGRVPTHGVFEFSRTLDTVGPLAPDVAGLVLGMRLMEPGFAAGPDPSRTVARLRFPGTEPAVDEAVDAALAAAGLDVADEMVPDWDRWIAAADDLMLAEGYPAHRHLLDRPDRLEERHVSGIERGRAITAARVVACRREGLAARTVLGELLATHGALALPTLRSIPPRLGERYATTYLTVPLNLAGLPAVSLPVPRPGGGFPASLQLVGAWYAEESLLALARRVESAVRP
ncbi:MAG: amidase [Streptosporangiales bacterium]|nr:amidase [Streptosporangiales bacterium]